MTTTKAAALHPISEELAPFKIGEIIAFREDHATHGATLEENGGMTASGKYGIIRDIGLDADGNLAFDVTTYDSTQGPPPAEDAANYRATMGEIQ